MALTLTRDGVRLIAATWTRPQTAESIPLQKWNSPQGEQVHYRPKYAAAGA